MRTPETERFVKNMTAIRYSKSMSCRDVSKQAELKRLKCVEDWECGRGYPRLEEIVAISKLFNVSLDNMLTKDVTIKVEFI